ncbi:MAG: MotA/TolQ/ExbB proton channel family protein [Pseudomonadota bacterium]
MNLTINAGLRRVYAAGLCLAMLLASMPSASAQSQLSTTLDSASAPMRPAASAAFPVPIPLARSAAAPSPSSANPYGLAAIWLQGDWVAKGCLLLLALMSIASWYALLGKTVALRRLRKQAAKAQGVFDDVMHFSEHVRKLDASNPVRYVADAGSAAVHQYAALRPRVDYDTWLVRAIEQALSGVQIRMQSGMAVLATIGSTAPFVGLFGTVWAIYTALVKIGASGQASIDRVAGPVGEALIMTAIGLAVAVPAVFGYNWLLRQNKLAFESLRNFGAQLHSLLLATTDVTQTAELNAAQTVTVPASTATPAMPVSPAEPPVVD